MSPDDLLEAESGVWWASSSAEMHAMNINNRWPPSLDITRTGGRTQAEARLVMPGEDERVGRGDALRSPADRAVTLIGEQIAAARAPSDLAGQLLHAAAAGMEDVTHARAHLHL